MIWTPPKLLTSEQIVDFCDIFIKDIFPQADYPDEYAELISIKNQHS